MTQDSHDAEAAIAKTLRLRGTPAPVAQVSRRTLIVVLITGVAGVLGWSLMERRKPAQVQQHFTPAPPPETVTALPRAYVGPASVPILGPPLPDDLGRPILSAARGRQAALPSTPIVEPDRADPSGVSPMAPVVDPQVEDLREARRAAVRSSLFVSASARRETGQGAEPSEAGAAVTALGGPAIDARTTSVERLQAPVSPFILQAGAVIPAPLVTGLRSDALGMAIAQGHQGRLRQPGRRRSTDPGRVAPGR